MNTALQAFGALSATSQLAMARAQIDAAKARRPLASLAAEAFAPEWLQHPSNDLGAYLRVAFWLGAGARPYAPGGQINALALSYAEQAYARAQAEYNKSAISFSIFGTEADQIDSILAAGESQAKRAGRVDVAALLNQIRGLPVTENQGWVEWLAGSPEARGRLVAGYTTASVVVTALLVGGVLAYFFLPEAAVFLTARDIVASAKRARASAREAHATIARIRERLK